jgi:hypothetical protein
VIEVLLGVQPVPQPTPHKNAEGDCFACAMTAALRHLYPERPISFDDAWQAFVDERTGLVNNHWGWIRTALYRLAGQGYEMEITSDLVAPQFNVERFSHAWWQMYPEGQYAHRLEGYLRGGWVAFTEINLDGKGPVSPEGLLNSTDHILLLDGIRTGWHREEGKLGAALKHQVHVVCSAKGAYWIDLQTFLYRHGGSGWWLARRDTR